ALNKAGNISLYQCFGIDDLNAMLGQMDIMCFGNLINCRNITKEYAACNASFSTDCSGTKCTGLISLRQYNPAICFLRALNQFVAEGRWRHAIGALSLQLIN